MTQLQQATSQEETLESIVPGQRRRFDFMRGELLNYTDQGSARQRTSTNTKEPARVRPYQVGDAIKWIDWKAYARTEQFWLHDKKPENRREVQVVLDCHQTLFWPNKQTNVSAKPKIETAFKISQDILCQHLYLGDRVYLWVVIEGQILFFKDFKNAQEVLDFSCALDSPQSLKSFSSENHSLELHSPDVLLYYISDLLQSKVHDLRAKWLKASIHVLHFLSHLELDYKWVSKKYLYADSDQEQNVYSGNQLLANAKEYMTSWLDSTKEECKRYAVHYSQLQDRMSLADYERLVFSEMDRS